MPSPWLTKGFFPLDQETQAKLDASMEGVEDIDPTGIGGLGAKLAVPVAAGVIDRKSPWFKVLTERIKELTAQRDEVRTLTRSEHDKLKELLAVTDVGNKMSKSEQNALGLADDFFDSARKTRNKTNANMNTAGKLKDEIDDNLEALKYDEKYGEMARITPEDLLAFAKEMGYEPDLPNGQFSPHLLLSLAREFRNHRGF